MGIISHGGGGGNEGGHPSIMFNLRKIDLKVSFFAIQVYIILKIKLPINHLLLSTETEKKKFYLIMRPILK